MKDFLKKQDAEYKKSANGETTDFSVTPASAPKFWFLIGFGVLILLGGFMGLGIAGILMGAGSIAYGLLRDQRPKEQKAPMAFKVTPTTIVAGGQSFNRDDIHRLKIANPIFDRAGLDVYTTSAASAAGMAHGLKIAELSYGLTVETGGKAHLLAGGMDRTTAFGLLSDVSKILGLKVE